MERHLATVWESVADVVGDDVVVVQGDVRRTWTEFDDRAARLGSALLHAGLEAGSKVAQYLYNSPEYLESYAAALKIRAVPVNVNYRYLDEELLYLLDNSDAEALVFHSSLGERVANVALRATKLRILIEVDDRRDDDRSAAVADAVPYEDAIGAHSPVARITRDPSDITMIYTGGTTGMPKGVMGPIGPGLDVLMATTPAIVGRAPLSDPADIAVLARELSVDGRQVVALPACPLMHGTGLTIGSLPALTFGGRIVLLQTRGLDVDELWSTVESEAVQVVTVVGDAFSRPLLRALREGPTRDLSSMHMICSAGAMFSAEVKTGLLEYMPQAMIVDFIAATEGAMGVSISTKDAPSPTGRFLPNPGVKVLTEDHREVLPGSGMTGVVAIPGGVQDGYYKDAAKTASTFPVIDGVRYSIPGDWATVEADGMITLLGRGSQCINTGGEKVYPEEVEEVLKTHEAVEDCLVFGLPDERFGQKVVAVASLTGAGNATEAPTVETIIDSGRDRLATYKLPRALVLVDEVPRAPNGKADYKRARLLFENGM